jgi:hypothetical protein
VTFLLGLTLGLFVGSCLGMFVVALCVAAGRDNTSDLTIPAEWDSTIKGGTE